MVYFILTLFGLVIGSFVTLVSYRIPKGQGFVLGRSYCDSCKKELRWSDNIPLFSFLLYQGFSRCCGKKISIRYPLIEVLSALGSILIYTQFGLLNYVVIYPIFIITLIIFVIDFEHQFIPDELTWLIFPLAFLTVNTSLFTVLFPAFVFSLFLLFLNLITAGRGMGLGDVKLVIPLGIILGFEQGLTWMMTTFIIGGIVSAVLLILKRAKLKTKIAFGPFLILAFWIVYFIK